MLSLAKYIVENFDYHGDINVENISHGINSSIYIVSFDNKKVILKILTNKDSSLLKQIKTQYDIQKYLHNKFPVSQPFFYCYDKKIYEYPFFVSEFINGEHKYDSLSIVQSYDLLLELHSFSTEAFSKKIVNNYLENFISRMHIRYKKFKSDNDPEIDNTIKWLFNNIPSNKIFSFTHNDWRMDNILFTNNRISAVLDWELFDIGDPRLDFAISFSWLDDEQKRSVIDSGIMKDYLSDSWKVFEKLGLLRILVILQSSRYKYNSGIINGDQYKDLNSTIEIYTKKLENQGENQYLS